MPTTAIGSCAASGAGPVVVPAGSSGRGPVASRDSRWRARRVTVGWSKTREAGSRRPVAAASRLRSCTVPRSPGTQFGERPAAVDVVGAVVAEDGGGGLGDHTDQQVLPLGRAQGGELGGEFAGRAAVGAGDRCRGLRRLARLGDVREQRGRPDRAPARGEGGPVHVGHGDGRRPRVEDGLQDGQGAVGGSGRAVRAVPPAGRRRGLRGRRELGGHRRHRGRRERRAGPRAPGHGDARVARGAPVRGERVRAGAARRVSGHARAAPDPGHGRAVESPVPPAVPPGRGRASGPVPSWRARWPRSPRGRSPGPARTGVRVAACRTVPTACGAASTAARRASSSAVQRVTVVPPSRSAPMSSSSASPTRTRWPAPASAAHRASRWPIGLSAPVTTTVPCGRGPALAPAGNAVRTRRRPYTWSSRRASWSRRRVRPARMPGTRATRGSATAPGGRSRTPPQRCRAQTGDPAEAVHGGLRERPVAASSAGVRAAPCVRHHSGSFDARVAEGLEERQGGDRSRRYAGQAAVVRLVGGEQRTRHRTVRYRRPSRR